MKIKTISVEIGQTRTANYQSVTNRVGLTADLAEGDDPEAAVRELQRAAGKLLLGKRKSELGKLGIEQDEG